MIIPIKALPPTVIEPLKSMTVALAWGAFTAIGTLSGVYFTDYHKNPNDWHSWGGLLSYLVAPHSVGSIAVSAAAIYRMRQGYIKAKAS